jgi:hypothetical protein
MNDAVQQVLRSSGWHPGRDVPCDDVVEKFCGQGFAFTPLAMEILRHFGGLTVKPIVDAASVYLPSSIVFNPTVACDGLHEVVQEWENRLGCTLSPIASLTDGPIALLVGSDECIYGIWGMIAWKYGESFVDALDNTLIVAARHPILLGEALGGRGWPPTVD